MAKATELIKKAEFNPQIVPYTFWGTLIVLFITIGGIPFIPIWVLGFGQWMSKRVYKSLECELTNKNLRFKKGVFTKIEKTVPLANIQDLTFIENPILRLFGLKILKIETAGQNAQGGEEMKLVGIMDVEKFKFQVIEQRELLVEGQQNNSIQKESEISSNTNDLLIEIRDLLKVLAEKK